MCNHEEDFRGIAKYKHKYTAVDKYIIGICLLGVTLAIAFMAVCFYQLVLSL
jgi:uncharacterized membrane protein